MMNASMAGSRSRVRLQSGVTLLELLIVLAIMGFIAGIAVPMFSSGVSTTQLKSAASEVAAGLRLARDQAIAQRNETLWQIDVAARAFNVPPDPRVHHLPERIEIKLFAAQSDLVGDNLGAIRFFPDGGSNGGRVTLAYGERKYEVDVDWLTGRIAILE